MATTTATKQFKITYTSANTDMGEFHQLFDEALALVKSKMGQEHPLIINGKAVKSPSQPIVDLSPIDTGMVLGKFAAATPEHVDLAIKAAKAAQKAWGLKPWQERVQILRKAASAIRDRK